MITYNIFIVLLTQIIHGEIRDWTKPSLLHFTVFRVKELIYNPNKHSLVHGDKHISKTVKSPLKKKEPWHERSQPPVIATPSTTAGHRTDWWTETPAAIFAPWSSWSSSWSVTRQGQKKITKSNLLLRELSQEKHLRTLLLHWIELSQASGLEWIVGQL